jgi:uncharacterized protein YjbI with pentapeptide repeats
LAQQLLPTFGTPLLPPFDLVEVTFVLGFETTFEEVTFEEVTFEEVTFEEVTFEEVTFEEVTFVFAALERICLEDKNASSIGFNAEMSFGKLSNIISYSIPAN